MGLLIICVTVIGSPLEFVETSVDVKADGADSTVEPWESVVVIKTVDWNVETTSIEEGCDALGVVVVSGGFVVVSGGRVLVVEGGRLLVVSGGVDVVDGGWEVDVWGGWEVVDGGLEVDGGLVDVVLGGREVLGGCEVVAGVV